MLPSAFLGLPSASAPSASASAHAHTHAHMNTPGAAAAAPSAVALEPARTHTTQPMVTGSSVLGVRYRDGVLLAADTLASYGSLARYKSVRRVKAFGAHTLIGATGELSDFQWVHDRVAEHVADDQVKGDNKSPTAPSEIFTWLNRVQYQRRCKADPLYNVFAVAGYDAEREHAFLGYTDPWGCSFEDVYVAAGFGAHVAMPLLRRRYRDDMSEDDARALLKDVLRVCFYRDCRSLNRVQIARVSAAGIAEEIVELDTQWTIGMPGTHHTSLNNDTF